MAIEYAFNGIGSRITTYSDSDWAGDRQSRKSTSGGCSMLGNHLIKSWSSNQSIIALSSGEAELYAITKAACQTIGLVALAEDFGEELSGLVIASIPRLLLR